MIDWIFWSQWIACGLALAGAFLLATNTRYSRYGWLFFMASNVGWIIYALITGVGGLTVQNIGFSITSGIGIWQWFFKNQSMTVKTV